MTQSTTFLICDSCAEKAEHEPLCSACQFAMDGTEPFVRIPRTRRTREQLDAEIRESRQDEPTEELR